MGDQSAPGGKLHLVTTVAAAWIPLAAELTPANVADNAQAATLIQDLPPELRFLLGDKSYHDPDLEQLWENPERVLVTTHHGRYLHTDPVAEVRRIFHQLRSRAMENFNEPFKGIFAGARPRADRRSGRDPPVRSGGPSTSINWPCSIASKAVEICASVSNHSYRRRDE